MAAEGTLELPASQVAAAVDPVPAGADTLLEPSEKETAAEAGQQPATKLCQLCRRELPADSKGRLKKKTFACRHCLTVQTVLYRNLGPGCLEKLALTQKREFFAKSAEEQLQDGYCWKTAHCEQARVTEAGGA